MVSLAEMPTIEDVAAAVGRSRQMLHRYAKAYGVDIHSVEAVQAHIAQHGGRTGSAGVSDELKEAKALAEIDKLEQDAKAKELDNRVREGELVNRDAVGRWLSSAVTEIRQQLESLPATIVSEVPGDSRLVVNDVATEQVRLLLMRLSQLPEELWADEGVRDAA